MITLRYPYYMSALPLAAVMPVLPKLPMLLIVSGTYTLDESGRVVGSLRCCHEK